MTLDIPANPALNHVPVANWIAHDALRRLSPFGIIALPYEPVTRHRNGRLVVRASNGVEQGFYDYRADVFYTDAEWSDTYER